MSGPLSAGEGGCDCRQIRYRLTASKQPWGLLPQIEAYQAARTKA
jgi:hypothetical protein